MRLGVIAYTLICLALFVTNCSEFPEPLEVAIESEASFDVFIIMGQSNTLSGKGRDASIDVYPETVLQLGRKLNNNYKIIPAVEPLDNHNRPYDQIGYANKFSKLYDQHLLEKGRNVLLIPCGLGATSFHEGHWNQGDTLYVDALERATYILENTDSELKGILWHQGESDINNRDFRENLDDMIAAFRTDIGYPNLPFILGGLCPDWVDEKPHLRDRLEQIISTTPDRVANTRFVNPRYPTVIHTDPGEYVHYSAEDQREMGRRYFLSYLDILN